MNRGHPNGCQQLGVILYVPRERGDEPWNDPYTSADSDAIHVPRERGDEPNGRKALPPAISTHVPRERGDEPPSCLRTGWAKTHEICSPRARG